MHNDHDSFTECVLVGGVFDGRREMISDTVDEVRLAISYRSDLRLTSMSSEPEPVNFNISTVTYYRRQLTAEGLRRPLYVFVIDREASTGWLIQRLMMAYPGPKTDG